MLFREKKFYFRRTLMIISVIVCFLSCAGLMILVLTKPTVSVKGHTFGIYWLPALCGSIFLLLSGTFTAEETWEGLTASGDMNPLKILALFLCLTFLSVYLDELGFFRRLAAVLIGRTGNSGKKLFIGMYGLVSFLTVFTSNDIVVLTFTPVICNFCREEKISPIPYLVGEFVAANTWSLALVIGNPTNIYLSSACGIGFGEYFSVMWLPTLAAGLTSLAVLLLLFHKQLSKLSCERPERVQVLDRGLFVIGVIHLAVCIAGLAASSWLSFPMWAVALGGAASLWICTLIFGAVKRRFSLSGRLLGKSLKRAPWELVPFVLSMFVIVLSLEKYGVTEKIAAVLGGKGELFKYGFASFLVSNVINNIPMSVLFGGVLGVSEASLKSIYATIIGSNLGACLTPVGALAGIMWTGLLKSYGVKFSFRQFIGYGAVVALPALLAALGGVALVLCYT